MDEVKRPEGPTPRSQGPEGPETSSTYFPIHSLLPTECIGKYCPRNNIYSYIDVKSRIVMKYKCTLCKRHIGALKQKKGAAG